MTRSLLLVVVIGLVTLAFVPVASAEVAKAGHRAWTARYDGAQHDFDQAQAIAVSPTDGRVYVIGALNFGSGSLDAGTVAYDGVTGTRLWAARYSGTPSSADEGDAIAVSPDGSMVFVTGYSQNRRPRAGLLTLAYDAATGTLKWRAFVANRVNGLVGFQEGKSIGVSPDSGTVFVTGSTYSKTLGWQYTTIAYGAVSGTRRWLSTFNAEDRDYGRSLAVSPDGSTVYVTGTSDVSGGFSTYYTIAYRAADGVQKWAQRYPLLGDAAGLGLSPDGARVFVTGTSSAGTGWNFVTVSYAASTGAQQWDATYDGPAHREDYSAGLSVSPDGTSLYVTGTSLATSVEEDFATVAYDTSTGNQLWAARHLNPALGQGDASGVVAGPGGTRVYVTGWDIGTSGAVGWDTIAYRAANGDVLWNSRLEDRRHRGDFAIALAVSADRTKLYVTGEAFRPHHDGDYTTVAYETGARTQP